MNTLMRLSATKKLLGLAGLLFFSASAFAAPPAPSLLAPTNGIYNVPLVTNTKFSWSPITGATAYRFVISQDSLFRGFVDNGSSSTCDGTCVTDTKVTTTASLVSYLKDMSKSLPGHTYWWKVRVNTATGATWSSVSTFTTAGKAPDFNVTYNPVITPATKNSVCSPQCLPFVQLNLGLSDSRGFAKNVWPQSYQPSGAYSGYTSYAQGASAKVPEPGDILVWGPGLNSDITKYSYCKDSGAGRVNGCGHVAIV